MLWLLIACQTEPKPKEMTPKEMTKSDQTSPADTKKNVAQQESNTNPHAHLEHHSQAKAPPPLPKETGINSAQQKVAHPLPLDKQKRQTLDVCIPYYKLLELETQRGSKTASEKERISALRELNKLLDYHPAGTAQAIVELEKEHFEGKIELSIEKRTEYWYSIHSYIGGICRVDLSQLQRPTK